VWRGTLPAVQVNDLRMSYEIHGEGPPLVLIPGRATGVSEWGSILDGLATRYRAIALDNRGAGRTDRPTTP
jgi:pimeloyl-ACP methyl ester carboxylesterase